MSSNGSYSSRTSVSPDNTRNILPGITDFATEPFTTAPDISAKHKVVPLLPIPSSIFPFPGQLGQEVLESIDPIPIEEPSRDFLEEISLIFNLKSRQLHIMYWILGVTVFFAWICIILCVILYVYVIPVSTAGFISSGSGTVNFLNTLSVSSTGSVGINIVQPAADLQVCVIISYGTWL